MVLVTRARALHKGHGVGGPAVRKTDDAAARGAESRSQTLHLHVGNAVFHRTRAQIGQTGHVIGLPARGHHDGAHVQLNLVLFFRKIKKFIARHPRRVGLGQGGGVQHIAAGEGEGHGFIQALALGKAQIEFAGSFAFQAGGQQAEVHIVGRGAARAQADPHAVVALAAREPRDFGHGQAFDARVFPDALELDFQAAGGGTEFGEIFVELSHAAAEPGRLFDDIDVVAQFRRFNGGCEA